MVAHQRIVSEVHKYGTKIGIQIGHAGRKATDANQPVGASEILYETLPEEKPLKQPRALTIKEIHETIEQFKQATKRAVAIGFDVIELHGAHGYLLHQFMSPLTNNREDEYGQDLAKFGVEVIQAMKSVMPKNMPLIMRLSTVEYVDGGYDLQYSLKIAKKFKEAGVDVFHISSGGEGIPGKIKPGNYPAYQVPLARAFKKKFQIPIIAVGKLENPEVAEATLSNDDADLVAVARGMLNDPYWSLHAIKEITHSVVPPIQYARGIR